MTTSPACKLSSALQGGFRKALAGFFQLLEQGAFDQDEDILFVHTGGAGALFAVEMV